MMGQLCWDTTMWFQKYMLQQTMSSEIYNIASGTDFCIRVKTIKIGHQTLFSLTLQVTACHEALVTQSQREIRREYDLTLIETKPQQENKKRPCNGCLSRDPKLKYERKT